MIEMDYFCMSPYTVTYSSFSLRLNAGAGWTTVYINEPAANSTSANIMEMVLVKVCEIQICKDMIFV